MVRICSSLLVAVHVVSRINKNISFLSTQVAPLARTGSEQVELCTVTTLPVLFANAAYSLSQRAAVG